MDTPTKLKIIKIIEKRGPARPVDLCNSLDISPQALHRHLKSLVQKGTLEQRGHPPVTRYALAGIPDFSSALRWLSADQVQENPLSIVCETRDVLAARLSHLNALVKQGLPSQDLPLIISVAGEIGNNSFDHNLGQWRDVPGCWFESQITGARLWICIADRGQGVLRSLARVLPALQDDQAAIETAFEKHVSGRTSERRGNGLKFVRNIVTQKNSRGLVCISGNGRVHYGNLGEDCAKGLNKSKIKINGTLTLILWELS